MRDRSWLTTLCCTVVIIAVIAVCNCSLISVTILCFISLGKPKIRPLICCCSVVEKCCTSCVCCCCTMCACVLISCFNMSYNCFTLLCITVLPCSSLCFTTVSSVCDDCSIMLFTIWCCIDSSDACCFSIV